MARPKNIKPTIVAFARIPEARHVHLVEKYGSIAKALTHLYVMDKMVQPAALNEATAAPSGTQPAEDQPPEPSQLPPAPSIEDILAMLPLSEPGAAPYK